MADPPAADASTPSPAEAPPDITAALLAALEQPATWAIALAGFLARGGLIAFLLPIVVLPTPAAIQAGLAPLLVPFVFGQPSPGLVVLGASVAAFVVLWLVAGGLIGGWSDAVLARATASTLAPGDERWPSSFREAPLPMMVVGSVEMARAFAVRVLAHLPLIVAVPWSAVRIGQGAYAELVTPFEVSTPLVFRIAAAAPEAILVVLVAWLLGEAAGGLAVREVVLGGRSVAGAAGRGWLTLVGHPLDALRALLLGTAFVGVAVLPGLIAAAAAWSRLRLALYEDESDAVLLLLVAFVALWLGALILAGASSAARGALWTAVWVRRAARDAGPSA